MLSDEVLEKVSERLTNRIERANLYILTKMAKNIKKIGELSYTEAYEIAQIMKYGGDYDKILNKLAELTELNQKDIEKIFEEVAKSEYDFSKQYYDYKNVPYVPYKQNLELQNQVKAITNLTQRNINYMMNPSTLGYGMVDSVTGEVTYKGLNQAYFDLIDQAVVSVSQGKETFNEAMANQIREMGGGGLRTIYDSTYVDKDGIVRNRTRRLDSSVRMNMKDGLRALHNENQEIFGEQFGADGVEISVHNYPANDHAEMQGRQFSKEEYRKLQENGVAKDYKGKLIDINRTSKKGVTFHRPVSQYNCYHYTFSIVLGVSSPEYTDEQLEQIMEDNEKGFEMDGKHYTTYEGSQMQRRLETEIRKQKDIQIMAKESGQSGLVAETQDKIRQLTNKYRELSYNANLPTRMDRMKVSGYKRTNISNITSNKIDLSKLKPTEIYIKAEDSKALDNYYYNIWKDENPYTIRFKERYNEVMNMDKKVYKDEIIDLSTPEACEKLLGRVNGTLNGEDIKNIDPKLLAETTKSIYSNITKCPAWLKDTEVNFTVLDAKTLGNTIAETGMGNITLDKYAYGKYERLLEIEKEAQTISNNNMPWHSKTAVGYETAEPITHEIGHIIQQRIAGEGFFDRTGEIANIFDYLPKDEYGLINKNDIMKELIEKPIERVMKKEGLTRKEVIDKYVSEYGKTDYQEMFAETFANSQLGESNILGDELINYLREIGQWKG